MVKQHIQHVVDLKIVGAATTSGAGWFITLNEQVDPYIDIFSGYIALASGILAITWTLIRIYDRFKDK